MIISVKISRAKITDGRYVYMRGPVDPAQNTPLCNYTLMPTHMRYRFAVEELQDIQLAAPFSFFDTENFVLFWHRKFCHCYHYFSVKISRAKIQIKSKFLVSKPKAAAR